MKKRIIAVVVSVALLILSVLCVVPTLAKYSTEQGKQSEINSPEFYFASDSLSESVLPEYKIYGNSVSFEIRNYIDSFRVNKEDITYTVSATDGTLSSGGGTLTGDTNSTDTITLTYDGEEAEKEIIVTVSSTSPYVKELKAKFIFAKPFLRYEITDSAGSYYAELYIHTADTEQVVTLNWDKAELLIDETNDYVIGHLNAEKNSASITVPAYTTVKIVFFKNDITKDYSCDVTRLDGTVTMSTRSE
ncbi:MAG: hypothetical protein ACI3X1_06545 [Eubacteriales bacterium]